MTTLPCLLLSCAAAFAADWAVRLPEWALADSDETPRAALQGAELIVARPRSDSVIALDAATGSVTWRFALRGPVGALLPHDGGWILASDAGELVSVKKGTLRWRCVLAPGQSRIVNAHLGRVTSAWPVRGGPTLHDGVVYAAAGIHPVMGFTVAAVDAHTGAVRWTVDPMPAVAGQPHGTKVLDAPVLVGDIVVSAAGMQLLGGRGTGYACALDGSAAKPAASKFSPGKHGGQIPGELLTRAYFGLTSGQPATAAILALPGGGLFARGHDVLICASDAAAAEVKAAALAAVPRPFAFDAQRDVQGVIIGGDAATAVALARDRAHGVGRWTCVLPESAAGPLREAALAAGMLGSRLTVPGCDLREAGLPTWYAGVVVIARPLHDSDMPNVLALVKPSGGKLVVLPAAADAGARLLKSAGGELLPGKEPGVFLRPGAPRGSAAWGNPFATPGNTYAIDDALARAPLGLAWIGGEADGRGEGPGGAAWKIGEFQGRSCPSKDFPPVLVVGGRLLVQGKLGQLACFDAYTGALRWHVACGERLCADADAVYALDDKGLVRLNAVTGAETARVPFVANWLSREVRLLPAAGGKPALLIASSEHDVQAFDPATLRPLWQRSFAGFGPVLKKWYFHPVDFGFAGDATSIYLVRKLSAAHVTPNDAAKPNAEEQLIAVQRSDGRIRWSAPVLAGKGLSSVQVAADAGVVLVGDRGDEHGWSVKAARPLVAYAIADGKERWRAAMPYAPPLTIRGVVADDHRALAPLDLRTGLALPVTAVPRQYGCAYAIGSASASFMRSGSVAYEDLAGGSGIISVGGMRGGCTPDLVPGDGVVVRPNLAYGCLCSYPLFTSVGLHRRGDAMAWGLGASPAMGDRIGVNFGAPAARSAGAGQTLWLPPGKEVAITGGTPFFRLPARPASGAAHAFVACCGIEGLTALSLPLPPGTWQVRLISADPSGAGRTFRCTGSSAATITVPPRFAPVVHDFTATGTIALTFSAGSGAPIVCGLEAVRSGASFDVPETMGLQ